MTINELTDEIFKIKDVRSVGILQTNMPPSEMEIIVDGGDDSEIAECIFKNVPMTIFLRGDNEIQIHGGTHAVSFSRFYAENPFQKHRIAVYEFKKVFIKEYPLCKLARKLNTILGIKNK